MAGVLQRFEQRLEGAVTGAFARAFRSAVQPVEIASAIQREVDNSAHVLSRQRMLVPNDFTVELSSPDYERLAPFGSTLQNELAVLVQEHVDEQRYTLAGPLAIAFDETPQLHTGRFRVRSRTNASVTPVRGQRMTETAVRRSSVILEVNGLKHPLEPPGVVIGRGSDADLRIDDPGISRRHAEIKIHTSGDVTSVTVTDLGSTNGVVLNGHRVQTASVASGSEIRLGNTTVLIRNTADEGT
ncbi:FhaA domain-containing protein [Aeromicrobium sp. CF4.19]|uniref:FhaA domain-containing protein n=1 Tax=Aeromicrobium sp. CF4.19 TaxID=3373082 RepID=UPI003EE478F3